MCSAEYTRRDNIWCNTWRPYYNAYKRAYELGKWASQWVFGIREIEWHPEGSTAAVNSNEMTERYDVCGVTSSPAWNRERVPQRTKLIYIYIYSYSLFGWCASVLLHKTHICEIIKSRVGHVTHEILRLKYFLSKFALILKEDNVRRKGHFCFICCLCVRETVKFRKFYYIRHIENAFSIFGKPRKWCSAYHIKVLALLCNHIFTMCVFYIFPLYTVPCDGTSELVT